MIKNKVQKPIATLLLVSLGSTTLFGISGFFNEAHAFISVPVEGAGGRFAQIESVGTLEFDKTSEMHEAVRAGIIAAMNSALGVLGHKFNESLRKNLGVKNYLQYQAALVEGKYAVDAYRKSYGDQALTNLAGNQPLTDLVDVANDFEGNPINTSFDANGAAALGVSKSRGNQADFEKELQRLVVGASSLFASSIACGGINQTAIKNTTSYLAAASAGMTFSEIDPRQGAQFYQDMGRFGNPLTMPAYWTLQFQDMAAQNESHARNAATLELMSPGLKSPQKKDSSGRPEISQSLNLVSVGQQNAQTSLFNIALKGTDSVYDTSSFRSFIQSLLLNRVQGILNVSFFRFFGSILRGDLNRFAPMAAAAATFVASKIITAYGVNLYDKVSRMIFQGTALAESPGCRKSSQFKGFVAPTAAELTLPPPAIPFSPAPIPPPDPFADSGTDVLPPGSGGDIVVPDAGVGLQTAVPISSDDIISGQNFNPRE